MPTPYHDGPLSTVDRDEWRQGPKPGAPCIDAPVGEGAEAQWLLSGVGGDFKVLQFGAPHPLQELEQLVLPTHSLAAQRYDAEEGATYLVRPDQVVAARWKKASSYDIATALQKARGR